MPTLTPADFEPEEAPTGVTCLACGAESRRLVEGGALIGCRWCTGGTMTTAQVQAWRSHQADARKGAP